MNKLDKETIIDMIKSVKGLKMITISNIITLSIVLGWLLVMHP